MPKRLKKLLHDWVRVKLDPVGEENLSPGGIVMPTPELVRTGVVMQTGPGKTYCDGVHKPTTVELGQRVVFLAANTDNKQSQMLAEYLEEDEVLLPEDAILFVLELEEGDKMPRLTK